MQTYALRKQVEIKAPAGEPSGAVKGQAAVKRLRVVTVAEGLSWAEAKRRRALDRALTIVRERGAVRGSDV